MRARLHDLFLGQWQYRHTDRRLDDVGRSRLILRRAADGSKRADDQPTETIEPYDFKGIRPFAMPTGGIPG